MGGWDGARRNDEKEIQLCLCFCFGEGKKMSSFKAVVLKLFSLRTPLHSQVLFEDTEEL